MSARKTQLQVFPGTVKGGTKTGKSSVEQAEETSAKRNRQEATKEIRNSYMPGRVHIVAS